MAQSTSKSTTAKKSAAPPKTPESAKKPTTVRKSAPAKTATAKDVAKPAPKKAPSRAALAKGNGEAPVRKAAAKAARTIGGITPEQRYRMICDAAYFRAERRGFIGGSAVQDWLQAEAEIDELLRDMQ